MQKSPVFFARVQGWHRQSQEGGEPGESRDSPPSQSMGADREDIQGAHVVTSGPPVVVVGPTRHLLTAFLFVMAARIHTRSSRTSICRGIESRRCSVTSHVQYRRGSSSLNREFNQGESGQRAFGPLDACEEQKRAGKSPSARVESTYL